VDGMKRKTIGCFFLPSVRHALAGVPEGEVWNAKRSGASFCFSYDLRLRGYQRGRYEAQKDRELLFAYHTPRDCGGTRAGGV
jgi:hypothetical protein